jgi:hypothetical protein
MSTSIAGVPVPTILASPNPTASCRADALAARLEHGAADLAALAATLTHAEWEMRLPGDGRTIGVVVHHVASMYPIEIEFAQRVAAGTPVTDLTWETIHRINAEHARDHAGVTIEEATAALWRNSAAAAAAIRALTDQQLDRAAPISLYENAPLTCQFALEDHAVRHALHHLATILRALNR